MSRAVSINQPIKSELKLLMTLRPQKPEKKRKHWLIGVMGTDDGFDVSKQQSPPGRLKNADHGSEVRTFGVGTPG